MYAVKTYLENSALKLTKRGRRWRRFKAILNGIKVFSLTNQAYETNLFYFDYLSRQRFRSFQRFQKRLLLLWDRFNRLKQPTQANVKTNRPSFLKAKKANQPNRSKRNFSFETASETASLKNGLTRFSRRRLLAAAVWSKTRSTTLNGFKVILKWCELDLFENRVREVQSLLKYRLRGRFQRRIKAIVFPLMKRLKKSLKIKGAEFRCYGRFDRKQRAQKQTIKWGSLGGSDPSQQKKSTFVTVPLRFGAVGITLNVNYGYFN